MDKVSLIIPCYHATHDLLVTTLACLNSLNETDAPDEVIVVDDGSPLKLGGIDDVILLTRRKNGGYAAAVNTGLKEATGNIIVICNNDVVFLQPQWLEELIKPLKLGYSIASIRTTDSDGWLTEDKITEGDKFGSIWAMKRDVYETIGGLDETFGKGYFEDLDYHKRAEDSGFKIAKNHAGIVEHIGKATFRIVDPSDRSYATARARFKEKWGKVW
jgi:GT2 family glycosyltransferase